MPAPRATWKGHLKISLVSFPVSVYNAVSGVNRITLNQLHKDCHNRLKQQMVCPVHGEVARSDIAKGYEIDKDNYVIITDEELEQLKVATSRTIEVDQTVAPNELEPIYLDSPYYIAPDGPIGEKAYRVIREAMRKTNLIGLGRFVMGAREYRIALRPEGRGFLMYTLRSSDEVRAAEPYFEDVGNGEINKSEQKLAEDLLKNMQGPLDTAEIKDRYQEGLLNIIKAKSEGQQPVFAPPVEDKGTMNFIAALEESLKSAKRKASAPARKKPAAKSIKKPAAAVAKKRKKA